MPWLKTRVERGESALRFEAYGRPVPFPPVDRSMLPREERMGRPQRWCPPARPGCPQRPGPTAPPPASRPRAPAIQTATLFDLPAVQTAPESACKAAPAK